MKSKEPAGLWVKLPLQLILWNPGFNICVQGCAATNLCNCSSVPHFSFRDIGRGSPQHGCDKYSGCDRVWRAPHEKSWLHPTLFPSLFPRLLISGAGKERGRKQTKNNNKQNNEGTSSPAFPQCPVFFIFSFASFTCVAFLHELHRLRTPFPLYPHFFCLLALLALPFFARSTDQEPETGYLFPQLFKNTKWTMQVS